MEGSRGVGAIKHSLEIITETEQLVLPISATVVTAADYDQQCMDGSTTLKQAPGVRYISDVPVSLQGMTALLRKGVKGMK